MTSRSTTHRVSTTTSASTCYIPTPTTLRNNLDLQDVNNCHTLVGDITLLLKPYLFTNPRPNYGQDNWQVIDGDLSIVNDVDDPPPVLSDGTFEAIVFSKLLNVTGTLTLANTNIGYSFALQYLGAINLHNYTKAQDDSLAFDSFNPNSDDKIFGLTSINMTGLLDVNLPLPPSTQRLEYFQYATIKRFEIFDTLNIPDAKIISVDTAAPVAISSNFFNSSNITLSAVTDINSANLGPSSNWTLVRTNITKWNNEALAVVDRLNIYNNSKLSAIHLPVFAKAKTIKIISNPSLQAFTLGNAQETEPDITLPTYFQTANFTGFTHSNDNDSVEMYVYDVLESLVIHGNDNLRMKTVDLAHDPQIMHVHGNLFIQVPGFDCYNVHPYKKGDVVHGQANYTSRLVVEGKIECNNATISHSQNGAGSTPQAADPNDNHNKPAIHTTVIFAALGGVSFIAVIASIAVWLLLRRRKRIPGVNGEIPIGELESPLHHFHEALADNNKRPAREEVYVISPLEKFEMGNGLPHEAAHGEIHEMDGTTEVPNTTTEETMT